MTTAYGSSFNVSMVLHLVKGAAYQKPNMLKSLGLADVLAKVGQQNAGVNAGVADENAAALAAVEAIRAANASAMEATARAAAKQSRKAEKARSKAQRNRRGRRRWVWASVQAVNASA